jgi:hypothetical protein
MDSGSSVLRAVKDARDARATSARRAAPVLDCASARYSSALMGRRAALGFCTDRCGSIRSPSTILRSPSARVLSPLFVHIIRVVKKAEQRQRCGVAEAVRIVAGLFGQSHAGPCAAAATP